MGNVFPLVFFMRKSYLKFGFALAFTGVSFFAGAQCTPGTTISTLAGNHIPGYSGDGGPASEAMMRYPYAVAADAAGNVYIADYFSHVVRKVSTSGTITTIAGTGAAGYNGDGISAVSAQLNKPAGVTVGPDGNLYISDMFNERIRKVNLASGIISTVAGNGLHGGWQGAAFGNGGPATAAALTHPICVAFDCSNNMYIADRGSQTVRKVDAGGTITRFAGNHAGTYNGDDIPATAASLNNPRGLAADCAGNVYISDAWNNRIRKVDGSGMITTFAGTGSGGFTGDGVPKGSATLWGPWGITLDGCGNLYICDYDNYRVRKVGTDNYINTIAGTGLRGYTGDGGAATEADVYLPSSLAIMPGGDLVIAENGNSVVRAIGSSTFGSRAFNGGTTQVVRIYEGETVKLDDVLGMQVTAAMPSAYTWEAGLEATHGRLTGLKGSAQMKGSSVTPTGVTYTPDAGFTGRDEFTIKGTDGSNTGYTTVTVIVEAKPIAVKEIASGNVVVYPNPTNGTFHFDFVSEKEQAMTLVGTDVTGRVIYTANIDAKEGLNGLSVSLPAEVARPSIVRLTLMDAGSKKFETVTVMLAE